MRFSPFAFAILLFLTLCFALRPLPAADLDLSLQSGGTYNDHVEFGLSIDPSTSALAGREEPQLAGFITQNSANLQIRQNLGQNLTASVEYSPRSEIYLGEGGKLDDQFSGMAHKVKLSLKYFPQPFFLPIEISASTLNLNRRDPIYDTFEPEAEISLGQFLKYTYHYTDYKDDNSKEDYLLIGSTAHTITGKIQVDFTSSILAKIEYVQEWQNYEDNVGKLLRLLLEKRQSRNDIRYLPSLKLIQVLSPSLLVQAEAGLFFNSSGIDFYDFSSYAAGISLFWRANDASWLRAKASQTHVKLSNRERGPDMPDQLRKDRQFSINLDGNWQLHERVSVSFNHLLAINRTNSTAPRIPDILNYTNNAISFALNVGQPLAVDFWRNR